MKITAEEMKKYARLLLGAAAVKPGNCLMIQAEPVQWEFVNVLTREAYSAGIKYVHTEIQHKKQIKNRIENSNEDHLDFVPGFYGEMYKELIKDKWSLISIFGEEEPDLLKGSDSARIARLTKSISKMRKPLLKAIQNNELTWLVAAYPTPGWAGKVLGTEPSQTAKEKLWEILVPILRMEKNDPLEDWTSYTEVLKKRSEKLTLLKLRELRFTGPGTDLTVHLSPKAVWAGGPDYARDGRRFMPNIPTQEVYTLPDYRKTTGTVKLTMPVKIMQEMVIGGSLTFENGKVTAFSAEEGEEALGKYLELDESVKYIGEVALVDSGSPIFRSGKVFYSTLFDENAASHIALGSAYPTCLEGGESMSEEELKQEGANVSPHHTDIMIGSPEIEVTGITRDGKTVPIISSGSFMV